MVAPILLPRVILEIPTAMPPSASAWMALILPSEFAAYKTDAWVLSISKSGQWLVLRGTVTR